MKVYFAAHATTVDNEAKIASGWKDVELSELGMRQAKEMRGHVSKLSINLVCGSDLRRTTDTIDIAFGDSLPRIIDKRLRELNYGDYNGKPSSEVGLLKLKYIHEPFPNGESYEMAMERTHDFYRELKERHNNETILIIGHRATQYGLQTLVEGKALEKLLSVSFKWQPYWEYVL